MSAFDWQAEVRRWCRSRPRTASPLANSIVTFFGLAFAHTRCPDRAWFGTHSSDVSLVVGGIYLAAIHDTGGKNQGFWLLLDENPPLVDGVEYRPVKSTVWSAQPLVWAHAISLDIVPQLLPNAALWASFEVASAKVLSASRAASDRNSVQERRKKRRMNEFWWAPKASVFPDEIEPAEDFREGAKRTVSVNAYERDEKARDRCLQHFGRRCSICGFSFGEAYGSLAAGVIHVHHLRPLSEIGEEYAVDPVEDLRPVCPNCHAVLHLRKPIPFSIQELRELLGGRVVRAIAPD